MKQTILNPQAKQLVSVMARYIGESKVGLLEDEGFIVLDGDEMSKVLSTTACPYRPFENFKGFILAHHESEEHYCVTQGQSEKFNGVYRLFRTDLLYPRVSMGRKLEAAEIMKHPDPKKNLSFYDAASYTGGNLGKWIVSAVKTSSVGLTTFLTSGLSPLVIEFSHDQPIPGDENVGQIYSARRPTVRNAFAVKIYKRGKDRPVQEFSIYYKNANSVQEFYVRANAKDTEYEGAVTVTGEQIEIVVPPGYFDADSQTGAGVRAFTKSILWGD